MAVVLFNERKRSTRRASVLRTSMGAIPFGANGGRQSYADASRHSDDIVKLLKKNMAVAQAVGFQGLPATLVGVYKVNEALDEKGFERAIADASARQKGESFTRGRSGSRCRGGAGDDKPIVRTKKRPHCTNFSPAR